jgi:hypothetical protein
MAKRKYTVYEAGGTTVDIVGDAGGWFRRMAVLVPDYMDRSIRHGAYQAQTLLKIEFLQHAPGGKKFPDISNIQKYRAIDAFKRHRSRYARPNAQGEKRFKNLARTRRGHLSRGRGLAWGMSGTQWPAGGKLAQAMGYEHKRGSMRADIGWLSKSAARLGAKFQRGDRTKITKKMRGLYWAAGILLGKKNEIVQPARPVMLPFFKNRSGWILFQIEKRLQYHMDKDIERETIKYAKRAVVAGNKFIKTA